MLVVEVVVGTWVEGGEVILATGSPELTYSPMAYCNPVGTWSPAVNKCFARLRLCLAICSLLVYRLMVVVREVEAGSSQNCSCFLMEMEAQIGKAVRQTVVRLVGSGIPGSCWMLLRLA